MSATFEEGLAPVRTERSGGIHVEEDVPLSTVIVYVTIACGFPSLSRGSTVTAVMSSLFPMGCANSYLPLSLSGVLRISAWSSGETPLKRTDMLSREVEVQNQSSLDARESEKICEVHDGRRWRVDGDGDQ